MTLFKLTQGHFVVLETINSFKLDDNGKNPPRLDILCSYGAVVRVDGQPDELYTILERLEHAFQQHTKPPVLTYPQGYEPVRLTKQEVANLLFPPNRSAPEQPRDGST